MNCAVTIELGAYILGAVNAADRSRIVSHVAGCETCRRELVELSLLPGLLSRVSAHDIPPADPASNVAAAALPATLATRRRITRTTRRISARRRATRRQWLAAVAATAVAAGGAAAVLLISTTAQASTVLHGTNPANGLQATVRLTSEQWGTQVAMRLRHLPRNAWCQLVVHTRDGRQEVGASWTETSTSGEASLPAATSFRLSDISSVDIVTNNGKKLINLAKSAGT